MIILYGIPNCDTIKKARNWLTEHNIDYQFHDFKKAGLTQKILDQWLDTLGWEVLLNQRSMTWRKLSDEMKTYIDRSKATSIMLNHTCIIKRPVLDIDGDLHVGFKNEIYQEIFNHP